MVSEAPQPLTLANKVAIVTGASRGIGAVIALDLAKRGANLVLVYTSESSGTSTAALVETIKNLGNGAQAISIRADIRNLDSPAKIVSETRAAFGDIDVLVNNAGVAGRKTLEEIDLEHYNDFFETNVRGPLFMAQAVLPHLRAPGRIINISSVVTQLSQPGFSVYSATKGALNALTRVLSNELGPKGHTVNAVAPGPVESDMFFRVPTAMIDQWKKATPLGRVGTPDDISSIVVFLAEEQSRWVTGQVIHAAGGMA